MRPTNTNAISLEALRQEQPLADHPEVLATREHLARTRAHVPAARQDLERAETLLAQAESAAADAASETEEIDQRPLASARKRLADAESTLRVRLSALRQAETKAAQTEARVREELIARVRAVYQDRLPAFDAKIAEAAALDRELAEIAEIGRRVLSGAMGVDDVTYWTPLIGRDTCAYLHWRTRVEERGFVLPPASPAHTLPPMPPRATVSHAGFSNDGQRPGLRREPAEFTAPIGPSGQLLQPERRVTGSVFGTSVASWLLIVGALFR